jgi:hypothetical protein
VRVKTSWCWKDLKGYGNGSDARIACHVLVFAIGLLVFIAELSRASSFQFVTLCAFAEHMLNSIYSNMTSTVLAL